MPVAPAFAAGGTRFAEEYARGTLPCHIDHGTCKNRIAWSALPEEVLSRRDELLVLCADGLQETRHPYATVARLAFQDLAAMGGCTPVADEQLRRVMAALRSALVAGGGNEGSTAFATKKGAGTPLSSQQHVRVGAVRGGGVLEHALLAIQQLAEAEGTRLLRHLHLVLPPLGQRLLSGPQRDAALSTLQALATNGGPEAVKLMRNRGIVIEGH